uniref:Tax1-binding protein 3 n=1 Tax=Dicentrarchus labrax TaxID=13489 RepID=A0A8C4ITT8_DICLA
MWYLKSCNQVREFAAFLCFISLYTEYLLVEQNKNFVFVFHYFLTFFVCCSKGIYVTRITPEGPAHEAGLRMGDKILQVNGWDMTMMTHDQARKRLTKKNEDVVRLLVTRKSLEEAVKQSMGSGPRQEHCGTPSNHKLMH